MSTQPSPAARERDPATEEHRAAIAAVSAADPALGAFIRRAGDYEIRPGRGEGDYFASLASAIVFQQLAGRAAAAINRRVVATLGGRMAAEPLLAASPESLRAAGLSGNKAAALVDLATKTLDGTVPLDGIERLGDEEIIERLSTVRGIGRWTAEMFLIFELARPDVWPVDDYGVRNGWTMIHELPALISPRELRVAGDVFVPHRSIVALYCWHAVHVARGQVALPG